MPESANEPSKEMRAQMAQLHEQMAACLKSDKSFADCHQDMMANCPMAKDGNCPMMGSKMPRKHHRMMKDHMGVPEEKTDQQKVEKPKPKK
jgi:hypothetical protein